MTDIVERLRNIAADIFPRSVIAEAADEIERLRADLAECERESETLARQYHSMKCSREDLHYKLATVTKERDDFERKWLAALKVPEVVRLEEQLAECERERDLHYGRVASLIYSEAIKDVFSRDVQKWHSEYVNAVEQLTTVTKERDELASAFIVLWISQDAAERTHWDAKAVERFDALLAKLGADKEGS